MNRLYINYYGVNRYTYNKIEHNRVGRIEIIIRSKLIWYNNNIYKVSRRLSRHTTTTNNNKQQYCLYIL